LIATLGRLGRHMAALPETAEPIEDAGADATQDGATATDQTQTSAPVVKDMGTAGKKKKKGKK